MFKHFVSIFLFVMPAMCFGADTPPDIQVHPSGSDAYVLTLTSAAITNVPAAQADLMRTAQKTCADKIPQFGHYKFESKAPLGAPANDNGTKASFVIDQEIACVTSP